MKDEELFTFFATMYDKFGQFAVIDFVRSRQENGQLQDVHWQDCNGCDYYTPFISTNCLVCGGY